MTCDETGERIPLTVADHHTERGTVTVMIQAVGKTTRRMMALREGARIRTPARSWRSYRWS